ncbi:MAG: CCA tRNA nucleotidyltransferase [Coriobacteriia bacterium]|nr:CCA tRNA nucleotidyltransferase [Coriobacteriia bacterium]
MISLPTDVIGLWQKLEQAGSESWLVGGCVRDALLGRPPHDWDMATAARPEEIAALLPEFTVVPTGLAFGTVTVLTAERPVEVTSFRGESGSADARHPQHIMFGLGIADDLARRDFTVNALAYAPARGLLDPFQGEKDLADGVLRAVGEPTERLQEDGLRILRALRFVSRLGLTVEGQLDAALHRQRQLLQKISAERLCNELMGILAGPAVEAALLSYPDVLAVFIPEISACVGFDQKSPWHCYDVWEHTVKAVGAASAEDPIVRLTLLFHDLGKPGTFTQDENGRGHFYLHAKLGAEIARQRLAALRFDRHTIDLVADLITHHLGAPNPEDVLRWLRKHGEPKLRQLMAVKRADMCAHKPDVAAERAVRIDDFLVALDGALAAEPAFSLAQMKVNGDDLLRAGYVPGPELGAELERLLDGIIDGRLANQPAVLLAAAAADLGHQSDDGPGAAGAAGAPGPGPGPRPGAPGRSAAGGPRPGAPDPGPRPGTPGRGTEGGR